MICASHLSLWMPTMIKQVVRLIRPGLFLPCFAVETPDDEKLVVRPRYLSICAADQRYFQGNRPPEVLQKKLPLALFHECLGEVLKDPGGMLQAGTLCVLLPGGLSSTGDDSNYEKGAFFRSSNTDGFCQEIMCLDRRELIPVSGENSWMYVFSELMSVCCQALRKLEDTVRIPESIRVGIWGDGSLAYMLALTLSHLRPSWEISVYGKHDDKLINFSFAKQRINIADKSHSEPVDIAFECVGGEGAQSAIAHAIQLIEPKGTIVLMGVSENPVSLPTRTILEKGLSVIGSSRSTKKDFLKAISLISRKEVQNSLLKIISASVTVKNSQELIDIFYEDKISPYKTVIDVRL